ncbi:MAG: hypothetical protein ACLR5H_06530 [Oscillospiraceae bacterium]
MLRDELRVLEISVWLENLQALRAGALKLETDLRTAQEDRQRAQEDLDAVYAAGEESLERSGTTMSGPRPCGARCPSWTPPPRRRPPPWPCWKTA